MKNKDENGDYLTKKYRPPALANRLQIYYKIWKNI